VGNRQQSHPVIRFVGLTDRIDKGATKKILTTEPDL
jgi:hypothetical protein